jgi:hypothetical protein
MPKRRSMLAATIIFLPIVPLAEAASSTWSAVKARSGRDNGVAAVDNSLGANVQTARGWFVPRPFFRGGWSSRARQSRR